MSENGSFFAVGQYVEDGIFLARCVDCNEEIGTFNPEDLLISMLDNAGRGGMKCPHCRKFSCVFCGQRNQSTARLIFLKEDCEYGFKYKPYSVCKICTMVFQKYIESEVPF